MEFAILVLLGTLGAGLVAGGLVLLRRSTKSHIKAIGVSTIAAGSFMLVLISMITPLSRITGSL
jgi:hypothetical protein